MVQFPPDKIEVGFTPGDVNAKAEFMYAMSRAHYLAYRHTIRPNLLDTYWQRDVAAHLMEFWEDLKAGKRPALILQAPPQHGKSEQVMDFVSWVAGQNPNMKTIFGSYSEDLGIRVNMQLQRMYDSETYRKIFANTKLNDSNVVTMAGRYLRNSSILEYVGSEGSFRNTTVLGQINGMGLDLGVIDDPIKGRAEASSKVARDKVWNWFTDDFFGRFSNKAGFLMIMTRWHLDDPAGRWLEYFPDTKVLRYEAVAEQDSTWRKKGDALFPEMKPLDFLEQRKKVLTQAGWESVYQQRPIVAGGDMFPVERFNIVSSFDRSQVRKSIRYVDKAGTEDGGAYSCGSLVHDMRDGTTVVEDVIRGQWNALERETRMYQAAQRDKAACRRYSIWFEQEPGSGGKESAEASVRRFKAFGAFADKVTGSKEIRAEPYAAQVQAGQVSLVAGEWNRAFLEEHEQFPNGKFKDQVDATSGAFNKLAESVGKYDSSLSWVG